jgi:hypothetical protein
MIQCFGVSAFNVTVLAISLAIDLVCGPLAVEPVERRAIPESELRARKSNRNMILVVRFSKLGLMMPDLDFTGIRPTTTFSSPSPSPLAGKVRESSVLLHAPLCAGFRFLPLLPE